MARLRNIGTTIQDQVLPAFTHYTPLLRAEASTIRSIPHSTFSYSPVPRHQLDVYFPPNPSIINGRRTVLFFFYGGGFVQGHRTLPLPALDGLVHANMGSFFARKFGYTVVIPDYSLLSHGAEFPSGGEEVGLAVKWVCENVDKLGHVEGEDKEAIDLFIVGNSAGGVHVSTYLFCEQFRQMRASILEEGKARLRGVVLLSVPFSYERVEEKAKREILEKYLGDVEKNCPLALMKGAYRSQPEGLDFVKSGTRMLVLNAEWDPSDECLEPRDQFVQEWLKLGGDAGKTAMAVDSMQGQDHISPCLGLGTGIGSEEAWGHQVAAFCNTTRQEGI